MKTARWLVYWMISAVLVLSAHGAGEDWSIILKDAMGEGKDISVAVASDTNGVVGAFGHARRFNKMPHIVDATKLHLVGNRLSGTVDITIPFDGWVPRDRKPLSLTVRLDAVAEDGVLTGSYDMEAVRRDPVEPGHPLGKVRDSSKTQTPPLPPDIKGGVLLGTHGPAAEAGQVCRMSLNCVATIRKSGQDKKGAGIGVVLSFKNGKSFAARMVPRGSITDVALTATAGKHNLTFDGRRLHGSVSATVYHNENTDESNAYELAFDGMAIGGEVSGTVHVTRDGSDLGGQVFHGSLTSTVADPDDALYSITLHKAIPMHHHLNVLFTIRSGTVLGGFAVTPHFNNAIHTVDFSGIHLDGDHIDGDLRVTIMPDAWIPRDHKPVQCVYKVDAMLEDGEIQGGFRGLFGGAKVNGTVEGSTGLKPGFSRVSKVTLKVENGVFGRAFLTMSFEDGVLAGSSVWNNHDRSVKGSVDIAQLDFSDERIRGVLRLRKGRGGGEMREYTCTVDGILVGTIGAGAADTVDGEGHRKMSTFWVSVTPAAE